MIRTRWTAVLAWLLAAASAGAAEWRTAAVPGPWEIGGPPEARALDGVAWYRAWVRVPDSFVRHPDPLTEAKYAETVGVVLAGVADAFEVFVNGVRLGGAGAFPPAFQAAGPGPHRHPVPRGVLRAGAWNEVALRVYNDSGPGGLVGPPPRLMNTMSEGELAGVWEFLAGDGHHPGPALAERPARAAFDQFRPANFVLGAPAALERGPRLAPAEALARMAVPPDLAVDLLLHEPLVTQPTHLSFDTRGRLWVSQYRQYPYPAGLRVVGRTALAEAVFDRVPPPPPGHDRGADRITIHEDTDGDGRYDRHRVFLDGLNLANAAVRGRGGVWVSHPPYLLFYPDRDGDDVPDGDPEVHLQGFGLEDTHAVINGLAWGPDGWLYGGQGSTTTSRVTRPGLDPPDHPGAYFDGSMVWRYHPESRAYEVFAKGGGNTFGLEFDADGRLYSGHNGGGTRGFHYLPGGYYTLQRPGAGEVYAFGQLPAMRPEGTVRRFSHFGAFADGTALPAPHQGRLFALDPLHNEIIAAERVPWGATFATRDTGQALGTTDRAFRPLAIVNAPDGSLLVADMCEYFTAHRNHYQSQIDPDSGRVWRLRGRDAPLERDLDLEARAPAALVALLDHPNKWHRRAAVQLLGERRDPTALPPLRALLRTPPARPALHALWALHQSGALADEDAAAALAHPAPVVRLWGVRLLGDRHGTHRGPGLPGQGTRPAGALPAALVPTLRTLAAAEPDPEVRAQLAAAARRWDTPLALDLAARLAARDEDAADPFIPLLLWWVLEAHERLDRAAVLAVFAAPTLWDRPLAREHLLPRLMRRLALEGRPADLQACHDLLQSAPTPAHTAFPLRGFAEAFRGREVGELPAGLRTALAASPHQPLILRLRQKQPAALTEALSTLRDRRAAADERQLLARALGELRAAAAEPALREVAAAREPLPLRRAALAALAAFDTPALGPWAAALLPPAPEELRPALLGFLASRAAWAPHLLSAVEAGTVPAAAVPPDLLDRVAGQGDPALAERARRLRPPPPAAASGEARVREVEAVVRSGPGDARSGAAVFARLCSSCHTLFGQGGHLGPDLTAYQRQDLATLIPAIVHPSAEIREGYQQHVATTRDGRVLGGFLVRQDPQVVVLRGWEGEDIAVRRADLARLEPVGGSLMPAGLLDGLGPREIRDLFAHLALRGPL